MKFDIFFTFFVFFEIKMYMMWTSARERERERKGKKLCGKTKKWFVFVFGKSVYVMVDGCLCLCVCVYNQFFFFICYKYNIIQPTTRRKNIDVDRHGQQQQKKLGPKHTHIYIKHSGPLLFFFSILANNCLLFILFLLI